MLFYKLFCLHFLLNHYNSNEFDCPGAIHGWSCDFESIYSNVNNDHYYCELDVIPITASMELFREKYLLKKPVVIDASVSEWSNETFWSKDSLIHHLGNVGFESGRSLELVLNSGIGSINITLNQYLQDPMRLELETDMGPYDADFKEPLYIFDRSIWRNDPDFQYKYFDAPEMLPNTNVQYGILFLGISGTGATWHAHGETWAGVAFGRKRWFLYPPELTPVGGFWPGYSSLDWFKNIYPNLKDNPINFRDDWDKYNKPKYINRNDIFSRKDKNGNIIEINSQSNISDIFLYNEYTNMDDVNKLYKPIECIQKEGQLLYLPEFWWHAVLNIGDNVAAGLQTSESYTLWMKEIDALGNMERRLDNEKQQKKHEKIYTDLEKMGFHYDMMKMHERLYQASPNNAVHIFFVGHEYRELGKIELAKEWIKKAIYIDPSYIEAYVTLGDIYFESDHLFDKYYAEKIYRIAYVLNKNHPKVREYLMDIFKKTNRPELELLIQKHEKLPVLPEFNDLNREMYSPLLAT